MSSGPNDEYSPVSFSSSSYSGSSVKRPGDDASDSIKKVVQRSEI